MNEGLLLVKVILVITLLILLLVDSINFLHKRELKDGIGAILWCLILTMMQIK